MSSSRYITWEVLAVGVISTVWNCGVSKFTLMPEESLCALVPRPSCCKHCCDRVKFNPCAIALAVGSPCRNFLPDGAQFVGWSFRPNLATQLFVVSSEYTHLCNMCNMVLL